MGPFLKSRQNVYQALPLLETGWLEHGFGTRLSGEWNERPDLATLRQTHSDICVCVTGGAGRLGTGDAIITDVPGVRVGVRTADCVPILLVDQQRRAVAAIHAGWRGTAAAISPKAVRELQARFGADPAGMLAAIGPAIGPCCYEVGPEVGARLGEWFPERKDLAGRARIDLAEANRRQLVSAGVPEAQIHTAGLCTFCCAGEFHSWRRDRQTGARMVNAVWIV